MTQIVLCLMIGLLAGMLSGLLGIGGGIIMIPLLALVFGMGQHQAQGTTLALMVPPIGLLAAMVYYKAGYVDLKISSLVCLGFFVGGLLGAKFATGINESVLSKLFGVVMLILAIKMIFFK